MNASRPLGPNRFGPIWSVPMQAATARTPRLIASCTTGAASCTSHVVKMMSAPPRSSLAAQAFAVVALLPCVSQVGLDLAAERTAALVDGLQVQLCRATADVSNAAIAPFVSYAQPITIGSD